MRKTEYLQKAERRIARAEAVANARILRAFRDVLQVLERETVEYRIYRDRQTKKIWR